MRAELAALGLACVAGGAPRSLSAQESNGHVSVRVVQDSTPVRDALVRAGAVRQVTGSDGTASLSLQPGLTLVVVGKIGFRPDSATIVVRAAVDTSLVFSLTSQPSFIAPVVVTSTRTERRIEEEPLRIEVLGGDDVGEKSEMRPADSRTLLSEMSGVRVQTRSPLGATNVRIQGLPGRYTAILNDGLPLFGGQAGGFTLVDVVPLDLRQAEVIKGASSALYGPHALAGVVNLISRRPPDTTQVLLNQSAPQSTDGMGFLSRSLIPAVGLTVLAGIHQQRAADTDHDGWTDVPGFRRAEVRPRLFVGDSTSRSIMATGGGFAEDRSAGSLGSVPAGSPGPRAPFADSLSTRHGDVGVVGQWRASTALSFAVRASGSRESRTHVFGATTERDDRQTLFGELSGTARNGPNTIVAGAAVQRDKYSSADVPRFDRTYSTPGLFIQDTFAPLVWLSGTVNGRCDWSNVYGTICTPRLSMLARAGSGVSARLSAGNGWFAPTPVTDETETFALSRVRLPQPLAAERGRTASFDLTGTRGPLQVNGTLFANRVANPVGLRPIAGDTTHSVDLVNASGPLETHGGELFAVFNRDPFIATAYYSATRTSEIATETGLRREVPLTPRQSAGLDFAIDDDESGAYGAIEIFYTGRQALEDDQYATLSRPYTTVGILVSHRLGRAAVFLNGENLTGVRLTRYQPLVRTAPGEGGRWTVDPWAPLDGRRVNAGVRWHW
jgi:outer membrane receptor for ferrienterochelin and colicins